MLFSAILKIIRPINLVITFFSVIIAAAISAGFTQIDWDVIAIALSVTFSFAAGNVINDIIDFEIDKINRPERALPQGLLSVRSAKLIYIVSVVISLVLTAVVSLESLVILIGLNLLLLLYSTHLKSIVLLGNFVVAFATSFPLVLGGLAVGNLKGGLIPAAFAFFTNFIREIIKDIEDIKGDSSVGVKTFPQQVGIDKSIYFIIALLIILIVFDTLPYLFGIYIIEYFMVIMVLVNPLFVFIAKMIYSNREAQTLRKASNLIKLNMILGLIAILIGAQ